MHDIPLDMRNLQLPLHVSIHMSCQLDFTPVDSYELDRGKRERKKTGQFTFGF